MSLEDLIKTHAGGTKFTRLEELELVRLAQGMHTAQVANFTMTSQETVRARRKRLYRKLGVGGQVEYMAELLALSLVKKEPLNGGGLEQR